MPNIEIFGYNQVAYEDLKIRIDQAMESIGLSQDAVTTWISAVVTSCDGKRTPMPFIRVNDTKLEEIDQIIVAFKQFGIKEDCETLWLEDFVPASEMIPAPVPIDSSSGRSDDAHEA